MKTTSILPQLTQFVAAPGAVPLVVLLERIKPEHASLVGGKAANLARMVQAGMPVVPGFCVTTEAFRQHMAALAGVEELHTMLSGRDGKGTGTSTGVVLPTPSQNGSKPVSVFSAALPVRQSGSIEALLATGAWVRQCLAKSPLLSSLEQAVAAAWEEQGPQRAYAVRSSAIVEDGADASFAGQGETILNVHGCQAILDAMRACWISLFSDRAILYRVHTGLDPHTAAMAVVVQEMICPVVSGVLFTAEPLTGDPRRMIVEATYGLGQALASGEVDPDRIVLAKPELQICDYRVGGKAVEIVPEQTTGVKRRLVEAGRAETACADEATLRQLGRLALQAEQALGGPQDIEWAATGQGVFLLQSRPITVGKQTNHQPHSVWSNMNSWEVLPGVIAPMSWSLVQSHFQCMFDPVLRVLGIDIQRQPLFGLIAGRAYANVDTFLAIAQAVPLPGHLDFVQALGGEHVRKVAEQLDRHEPKGWSARLRGGMRLLKIISWSIVHAVDERSKRHLNQFRRHLDELAAAPLAGMSEKELIDHIGALLTSHRRLGADVAADGAVAAMFVRLFYRFFEKRLGRDGDTIANRLLEGLGRLASAEAGLELWELAAWARQRPALSAALAQAGDFASLCQRLPKTADNQEFFNRWQRFMLRHGHHACGELDVHAPRWSEMPDHVLGMLRGYLGGLGDTNPGEFRQRLAKRRAALAGECRRRLGNPFRAALFDYLLRKARFGVTLRENARNEVIRMLAMARRTLLELGDRLVRRQALAERDDLFYLELPELPRLVAGETFSATIAARKVEYAYDQTLTPPPVIVGRLRPEQALAASYDYGAQTLRGLPASAGVATGPARVMLDPMAGQCVLPGEILIAPFTDPGWTPHFLAAAGIVMDVGGMLSHGSIVAREYGIPTVVNVGPATRMIRTGQVVRVDGDNGVVTVLS